MNFVWSRLPDGTIEIQIKTPVVEVGTLYRLTAAIYAMGLDILSGDISSDTGEDGIPYSNDRFILQHTNSEESEGAISAKLGILMETLLRENMDPDEFLRKEKIQPPVKLEFFETEPVILFQNSKEWNATQFYIESQNRTGLLFHLTRILARKNVDIIRAKIRTENYLVKDTFYLQYNGSFLEPDTSKKIESEILSRSAV
ncbi:MAG: hypothetical protein OEZ34_01680 [Spirochaetia bacterium]|nr:hypothetical protein [Spirochaetia bacterium]